jgi:hypothetical protein
MPQRPNTTTCTGLYRHVQSRSAGTWYSMVMMQQIRTYTQPGDLVLDPCVGSGTTAVACRNTGRHYIVGDTDLGYVEIARRRLAEPFTMPLFDALPQPLAAQPELL